MKGKAATAFDSVLGKIVVGSRAVNDGSGGFRAFDPRIQIEGTYAEQELISLCDGVE